MSSVNLIKNRSLDIDSKPNLDASIEQVIFRKYRSDTNITPLSNEVVISVRDVNEFFSLTRSYLTIQGRFSDNTGGTTLSNVNSKVALESGGVSSCFSQARLRVQNTLVNDLQNLGHINAHVKRLVSHSKDYMDTQGRACGASFNDTQSTDEDFTNQFTTYNAGHVKRRRDAGAVVNADYGTTAGVLKTFTLKLSDLFCLADCDKLLKNTSLKIELGLRGVSERIFASTNGDSFNLLNIDLHLAMIQPTIMALPMLEQEFSGSKPISYVYKNYMTYESPLVVSPTSLSYTYNVSQNTPMGCYVMLQQQAGSTQNLHDSTMFDRCNATQLGVKLNGRVYPYDRVSVNWGTGDWMGVYEQMTRSNDDYLKKHAGVAITPEQFFECYPIYWVDFSTAPPASSYQISVEATLSGVPEVVNVPSANARSSNVKILLTTVSLGEMMVEPLGGSTIVRST